jgi:hypothetical protein
MQKHIVLGGCTDFIIERVKKITSSSLQHILLANYIHQCNLIAKTTVIKLTIQRHWQIATKIEEHLQQRIVI